MRNPLSPVMTFEEFLATREELQPAPIPDGCTSCPGCRGTGTRLYGFRADMPVEDICPSCYGAGYIMRVVLAPKCAAS